MNEIDLDDFDAPDRKDFRRIGKGIPYVLGLDGSKRERYSRSSKSGDILDDTYNLWDWKLRTALMGAAQRPEILAMVSTLDAQRDKKQLRDFVEDCIVAGKGSARAVTGTAIHAMFDHMDREDDWDPAPQFLDVCNAYLECLRRYGFMPSPDEIEIHCVNDEFRLAGTLDRRYRTTRNLLPPDGRMIPIGSYLIGDTKTGDSLEYASGTYACQLAAYADSNRYDTDTDERIPFDPPTYADWGVVIHALAEPGTCEAYWVDLSAGREGLRLARLVKAWRNRTDLITPAVPPLVTVLPQEVADVVLDPIEEAPAPDVPGLKQEGHTAAQLDAIERAVDRVETNFSIPFGPADPRIVRNHPSQYHDRWARPKANDATPPDQAEAQRLAINDHPRRELLRKWVGYAVTGGIDSTVDSYALSNALYEFAKLPVGEWPDDDLTMMLDGSLRAIGYDDGLIMLGRFDPQHAPLLMSAAFAIASGQAILLYDEKERPIVRTINEKGNGNV